MENVTIEAIKLKIGDTVVKLTPEQARELKRLLDEMWNDSTPFPIPYPVPAAPPIVINPPVRPNPVWETEIICRRDTAESTLGLTA